MAAAGETHAAVQFFSAAAMQLLDHRGDSRREIAAVVPALLTLLSDNKVARTPAGEVVKRFLGWFEAEHQQVAATTGIVKFGWMRKISSSGFTTHRRWVVLDGTTLMYYGDQAVRYYTLSKRYCNTSYHLPSRTPATHPH